MRELRFSASVPCCKEDAVSGDRVLVIDADLQDLSELLPEMMVECDG